MAILDPVDPEPSQQKQMRSETITEPLMKIVDTKTPTQAVSSDNTSVNEGRRSGETGSVFVKEEEGRLTPSEAALLRRAEEDGQPLPDTISISDIDASGVFNAEGNKNIKLDPSRVRSFDEEGNTLPYIFGLGETGGQEPSPSLSDGRPSTSHVLAHEVSHLFQKNEGEGIALEREGGVSVPESAVPEGAKTRNALSSNIPGPALEAEADLLASALRDRLFEGVSAEEGLPAAVGQPTREYRSDGSSEINENLKSTSKLLDKLKGFLARENGNN